MVVSIAESDEKGVRVWDVEGTSLLRELLHDGKVVNAVADLGGGRVATGCAGNKLRVWDAASGALLIPPLDAHDALGLPKKEAARDAIWSLAALWGGRLATGHRNGDVVVWSLNAGGGAAQFVVLPKRHFDIVNDMCVVFKTGASGEKARALRAPGRTRQRALGRAARRRRLRRPACAQLLASCDG